VSLFDVGLHPSHRALEDLVAIRDVALVFAAAAYATGHRGRRLRCGREPLGVVVAGAR
jgi:hypothetical protein